MKIVERTTITLAIAATLGGCAQLLGVRVSFEPGSPGNERYSNRDQPAAVTTKTSDELKREGYAYIGTVTVSANEGSTADTQSAALEEAARRGGDVVVLTKNRERRSEQRFKDGDKCIEEGTIPTFKNKYKTVYDAATQSTRQVPDGLETVLTKVCNKYEQVPYTVTATYTVGRVYRRAELSR